MLHRIWRLNSQERFVLATILAVAGLTIQHGTVAMRRSIVNAWKSVVEPDDGDYSGQGQLER